MTSPYNRLVQTPAEKKAKAQSDTFAAFRQALDKPGDTTLDESDLIKMEFQEGGIGVGTAGYIMPGESAGTILQKGGSGRRVPTEAFREALTPEQQDEFFMPFPIEKQAPDLFAPFSMEPPEEEAPWYRDLPHIPGLSQAGATVRGGIGAGLGFIEEYLAEPAGAIGTVFEAPSVLGALGVPGFTDEFAFNPEQLPGREDWREKYKENIPVGARLVTEIVLDPLNVVPFGLAIQGARQLARLGKGGSKVAAEVLQQAENARNLQDPNSLFYRHLAQNLEEGQKQIIVVSNTYPQGRRITVQAGQDAEDALAAAFGRQGDGNYKILPGDASRAEVIKASGALLPDTSRILAGPQARGMGARAMEVVSTGRGNIPARLIANDVAAFVSREISDVEKAEFLSSFRNTMPTEVSYLDEAGEVIPLTRKVTPNPRGMRVPPKLQKVGPVVQTVATPGGFDDAFGNNQLYNIIDGDSPGQEVVAQLLIQRVGAKEGAVVKGFWPTVEGAGPGMFSTAGIQSIVRQLGGHHPSLSNLDFGGNLARPKANAQEFIGTPVESAAQRLSDSDITTGAADLIDNVFPRASSLDAARMNFDEYSYAGLNINRLDVEGLPKTVDDLLAEAQSVAASGPEQLAAVMANTGPRVPGQPLFSMTDDISAYSYLYAKAGAILSQAIRIPGVRWTAGLWNRAKCWLLTM